MGPIRLTFMQVLYEGYQSFLHFGQYVFNHNIYFIQKHIYKHAFVFLYAEKI